MAPPTLALSAMLELPLKEALPTDFSVPLIEYVTKNYQEAGTNYTREVAELNALRSSAASAVTSEAGLKSLESYAAQLECLIPRFPVTASGPLEVRVGWNNTFTGQGMPGTTLHFEYANVLYNIGATRANLGCRQWLAGKGMDEKHLRTACSYFQTAAGVFIRLGDETGGMSGDLAPGAIAVLKPLMLAQAQECIMAKALLDGRKNSLVARVCAQIAEFYDEAHTAVLSIADVTKAHPWVGWARFIRCKAIYYRALAQLYSSKAAREGEMMGVEISRLQAALSLCDDIVKLAKLKGEAVTITIDNLQQARDHIASKLETADRENRTLFHEKVEPVGALPEIKPASVVSPTPYARDPATVDIFSKLVPLSAHLSASEYSEKKAAILRHVNALVASKDSELQQALKAMDLTADGTSAAAAFSLPADVFTKAAVLRDERGEGLAGFDQRMGQLTTRAADLANTLSTCLLAVAEGSPLQQELVELRQSLNDAQAMDEETAAAWAAAEPHLRLLAGPADDLKAALPSEDLLSGPVQDEAARKRIDELMMKVKFMMKLRKDLVDDFRHDIANDDITQRLVTSADPGAVMAAALPKHEAAAQGVQKNIDSQDKLLPALIEAHASQAGSREQSASLRERQEAFVAGLLEAYDAFRDMQLRVKNGLEFYESFSDSLRAIKLKIGAQAAAGQPLSPALANPFAAGAPPIPTAPKPASSFLRRHQSTAALRPTSTSGSLKGSQKKDPTSRRLSIANPFDAQKTAAAAEAALRGGDPILPAAVAEQAGAEAEVDDPLPPDPIPSPAGDGRSPLEVAIDRLGDMISRLEVQHRTGGTGFDKEFDLLKMDDLKFYDPSMCSAGFANRDKNRYKDILPYDDTRVRMITPSGGDACDYINACHIPELHDGSPEYICSQGPIPATIGDFWKLVKQRRARVIVMVTNLVEMRRRKCEQYWPENDGETMSFPESDAGFAVDVTRTGEAEFSGWIERYFSVIEWHPDGRTTSLKVTQFHYTAWPDRGVPQSPEHFLCFRNAVANEHQRCVAAAKTAEDDGRHPILVHCSAGVGRTGTFCCVHSNLNALPFLNMADCATRKLDILETVRKMRKSRRHMVQSLSQYEFCYRCTLYGAQQYLKEHKAAQASLVAAGEGPAPAGEAPRDASQGVLDDLQPSAPPVEPVAPAVEGGAAPTASTSRPQMPANPFVASAPASLSAAPVAPAMDNPFGVPPASFPRAPGQPNFAAFPSPTSASTGAGAGQPFAASFPAPPQAAAVVNPFAAAPAQAAAPAAQPPMANPFAAPVSQTPNVMDFFDGGQAAAPPTTLQPSQAGPARSLLD